MQSNLGCISIKAGPTAISLPLKVINEKTVDYANGMLKNIDKKVKETDGVATLISDSTTDAL